MTIDLVAIKELFQDYADGFDDFDSDAIADCFAYPTTIWQLGKGNVFADRDELMENIDALLSVFESEEIAHSVFEVLSHAVSGPTALVALSWHQERENGEVALAFICHYTLLHTPDGLRIAMVANEP